MDKSHRKYIWFLFPAMIWACQSSYSSGNLSPSARPNIIFIMLDEWGYFESSLMGHPILETPNIDRFAREGMRFTQFLAGGNVCAPTRSVLLTGQHTGHTTVRNNGGGQALRDDDYTVAEMLKAAGYATGGFGKWGLGDVGTSGVPEKQGFDVFFGYYHQVHAHTYYPRYLIRNSTKIPLIGNTGDFHSGATFAHNMILAEGIKFIEAHQEQPFFAYFPFTPPHGLWHMPEDDPAWIKYQDVDWDATNQRGAHDAQMYAAMIEMVDRQIGELMALLKRLNIDEQTVVFLCGDNGGQAYFANDRHPHGFFAPNVNPLTGQRFRGGKRQFYEGGLRIPFMVRWPTNIKGGQVSDHLGYFPDIMPTLAEIAGVSIPTQIDGISILPTLLSDQAPVTTQLDHPYLYWEDNKSVAIRMQHWKAIRPDNVSPFELYNLRDDLAEQEDLAKEHPDVLAKMKTLAMEAHLPQRYGEVIDSSVGFKGHTAE